MAQRALQGRLRGASQPSSARRPTDWGQPFSRAQPQQQPRTEQPQLASQLLAAGVALGITLGGFGAVQPAVAATAAAAPTAAFTSLADIMRSNYAFVDEDKNGVITKEELVKQSQEVAEDVDFLIPGESQLDFAMKLFDLNQDGTLTTDELLASIALDGAVGEDAVDQDVYGVFDRDQDGFVSLREFKSGIPSLGANGEAAKEYIFSRVDSMVDGDGKLDPQEFANALTIVRTTVLGY